MLLISELVTGQVMNVTVEQVRCYNDATGTITISTDPSFNDAITIEITDSSKRIIKQFYDKTQQPWKLNNLKPGKYILTLQTSENKAKEIKTVEIENPEELKGNLITIVAMTKGEIPLYSLKANPSGGTPPYSYTWSDNANKQLSQVAENLIEGTYTCKITDSYGCGLTVSFFLYGPEIEKYKRSIKNK